jgi:hypothetical protein
MGRLEPQLRQGWRILESLPFFSRLSGMGIFPSVEIFPRVSWYFVRET